MHLALLDVGCIIAITKVVFARIRISAMMRKALMTIDRCFFSLSTKTEGSQTPEISGE
jgi:hypothetical protein